MGETQFATGVRFAGWTLAALALAVPVTRLVSSDEPQRLDPASWGRDHVGKPVPEYTTGDECLFCHREKVGTSWGENRHNLTIRPFDENSPARLALTDSPAKKCIEEIKFVMGDQHRQRFLRSAKDYGKLELLSVEWIPPRDKQPGKLVAPERAQWDKTTFADSCAGCHATAVDPKLKAFSSRSLDCYVCHGNVPAEHSKKPELAYLSAKRRDEPRVVTSICASCHVRTGKSKSTGRPYPTNFVAGDNLFRDFEIDFTDRGFKDLSTADKHVLENVRDVVVLGKDEVTCLSCHDVHGRSSKKHHLVVRSEYCLNCHNANGLKLERKPFSTHGKTCGY